MKGRMNAVRNYNCKGKLRVFFAATNRITGLKNVQGSHLIYMQSKPAGVNRRIELVQNGCYRFKKGNNILKT